MASLVVDAVASSAPSGGSARARRRPARYSPELPAPQQHQSEMSNGAALLHEHNYVPHHILAQLQQDTLQEADDEAQHLEHTQQPPQQQQQQPQQLGSNSGEQQSGASNAAEEMAPAVAPTGRGPGRPPRGKKRRTNSKKRPQLTILGDEHLHQQQHLFQTHNYQQQQLQQQLAMGKRPRVANVLLENEMLIDEIRVRKALWMRTHEQHHSSALTAPYWEEVAKALDTTQDNIRKRWKSLKDHYRRELKKSMTDPTAPPSMWPYYKKMRFMKSQMFVSLRRKNGEDHLEILSDDEDDINNQWNGHHGKMEGDSDTMDGFEMGDEYHELVKYEQHMLQLTMNGSQDEEEEEEETNDQQQQMQQENEQEEEQLQEQEELSPIDTLQEQEELSALQQQVQQQGDLSDMSNMSTIQQQGDISTITTIADLVGIPTIVTTTASSLSGRLSAMQQRELSGRLSAMQQQRASEIQRSNGLAALQQSRNIDEDIESMNARHTVLQQRQAGINNRLSAIQRSVEMNAMQQRANVNAMHERAEMTAMQQRAEMQQRNNVDNNVDSSNDVSAIDERGAISDDYHFFMSLMPHIRHFSSLQKLKVRNRIHQIIIEEASNIQYDPLGNC